MLPHYSMRTELTFTIMVPTYVAVAQTLPTAKRSYVQVAFLPAANLININPWRTIPTNLTTPNKKSVE